MSGARVRWRSALLAVVVLAAVGALWWARRQSPAQPSPEQRPTAARRVRGVQLPAAHEAAGFGAAAGYVQGPAAHPALSLSR